MALPTRHIRHQLPVLAALARTGLVAVGQRLSRRGQRSGLPPLPGPEFRATIPPRAAAHVRDYLEHVGGDPAAYRGLLPAHLFPQWGFALLGKTLTGVPYPLGRALNGGARLEINAPVPADQPLQVCARLEDIDDNGRRAVLVQRITTGTQANPDAVVGYMYAVVPLGRSAGGGSRAGTSASSDASGGDQPKAKSRPRVADAAVELLRLGLPADAGLAFAMLTGDFNPVHWVPPYARSLGFSNSILHGFSTMARAIEGLNRMYFAGQVQRLRVFDCKFTKPLVLPKNVGLYVDENNVYVGDAPGSEAYLVGSFAAASE